MTGPDTGGPPSGPRINLSTRPRGPWAAEVAGSYGRSATPLTAQRRVDNYRRQNGRATFTPRQWRRFVHKAVRAGARADVLTAV